MDKIRQLTKKQLLILAITAGFILGIGSFIGYRVATFKTDAVHYHANFALYINGQRDEFKSFTFYEEVEACAEHQAANPKSRVHMHDQDSSLIHVHDGGVTWGHFFANLGYGLTDKALQNDDGLFMASESKKLRFYLNGEEVSAVANRTINSEDRLLISYGEENDEELEKRFKDIAASAREFNARKDPGGCSSNDEPTLSKKLRAVLGIEEQH